MKTPPHRIAAVVLVLLVLAGAGIWWWNQARRDHPSPQGVRAIAIEGESARGRKQSESPSAEPISGRANFPVQEPCGQAMVALLNAHARTLRTRADAGSQLAYALAPPVQPQLGRVQDGAVLARMMQARQAEADRAFLRAAQLAPDDPEVLWLAATQCSGDDACPGVRASLLAAEPDNMAVWLWEMGWARMRKDPAAEARAFMAASAAPRFDVHVGAVEEVMMEAYGALALPPACMTPTARELMDAATGVPNFNMADHAMMLAMARHAIPAFIDIQRRCAPAAVKSDGEDRARCLRILGRLAEDRSQVGRAIALDLLVQLSAGAVDATQWRERYREYTWMREQMIDPAMQGLLQPEDYALDEVRSMQAALESAGRWPPPADWLPTSERARSLILTGRPPPESRR